MRPPTSHRRLALMLAALIAATALSACGSFGKRRAPFHVYNTSLLNGDTADLYARDPGYTDTLIQPTPSDDTRYADATPAPTQDTAPVSEAPPAPTSDAHDGVSAAADADPDQRLDAQRASAAPPAPAPKRSSKFVPAHSAGYIRAVYALNKIEFRGSNDDKAVADLYAQVESRGRVHQASRSAVGDLVFFHNTYDRNGDGRNNDWYTHVGLIEGVEADGTIHVLSFIDNKIDSFVINLEHPKTERDERTGKVWNTRLRDKHASDAPFTAYLGGELFARFGTVLGDRTEFVVIDNWSPGMEVR